MKQYLWIFSRKSIIAKLLLPVLLVMASQHILKAEKRSIHLAPATSASSQKMSLEQLIQRLIEKNFEVRMAALNYIMVTSDKDAFQAKYGFYFQGDVGTAYNEPPENGRNYLFEGSQQMQRNVNTFISKGFRSGTRVSLGLSSTYTDSGVDIRSRQPL